MQLEGRTERGWSIWGQWGWTGLKRDGNLKERERFGKTWVSELAEMSCRCESNPKPQHQQGKERVTRAKFKPCIPTRMSLCIPVLLVIKVWFFLFALWVIYIYLKWTFLLHLCLPSMCPSPNTQLFMTHFPFNSIILWYASLFNASKLPNNWKLHRLEQVKICESLQIFLSVNYCSILFLLTASGGAWITLSALVHVEYNPNKVTCDLCPSSVRLYIPVSAGDLFSSFR